MVCLGNKQRSFCRFWDCIQVLHFELFCWPWWLLHFFWGIPARSSRYKWSSELNSSFQSILVHWFLECQRSLLPSPVWPLPICLIHGPNISGSYAILFFTALDLASITSHIHNRVFFLLLLHLFILSGVISPLISCSILGTYRPGEFLFQDPIILPFHTVHGVLNARILKWFAIPFSSGPHSVRPLHHDLAILGGPTWHG